MTDKQNHLSVNAAAAPLVADLLRDAALLRLGVETLPDGGRIIDAGIRHRGGLEAGRRIAEICMGGLGRVALTGGSPFAGWPWQLTVQATDPVLACLASQYAGWSLNHKAEDGKKFNALGSGPGRALAVREPLFDELGYRDTHDSACLVLEVDKAPPAAIIDKVARDCGVTRDNLVFILTPTTSLAGTVQIVARVLEVALHKAHALGFPLTRIVDGAGSAPLPPPGADFLSGMGRTNDAILFGGQVQLFVDGPADEARDLAMRMPSDTSRDYGQPFADIFKTVHYDFYQIDPLLFAPARVTVTALESGESFAAGRLNTELLAASFGGTA